MSVQVAMLHERARGRISSGVAGIVQAVLERSFRRMGKSGYLLRSV